MILLLDYDGTLVPIVEHPDRAKIGREEKKLLIKLSEQHTVAIVTGRDIESFRRVFGKIPDSIYVISSHGSKVFRNEALVKEFSSGKIPDLGELMEKIKDMKGVFVEKKEGCFALHYRGYRGDEEEVRKVFRDFVVKHPPRKVIEGKKVLEALYTDQDKGRAVADFLRLTGWNGREPVIYIGDDVTDLYAFRKVKELGGTALFVGEEKPPEADGVLRNVQEVYSFLRKLAP